MNKGGAKKAAYDKAFNARPEEVAKRVKRNQARAKMEAAGKVSKGDGRDINHKTPLKNGGSNSKANLEVTSQTKNRGWRKDKSGYNP
jgi:hypothetical protein